MTSDRRDAEYDAQPIGDPERARHLDFRRTLYSFRHAGRGLRWAVATQANLRFHLAVTVVVLVAAVLFRFTALEFVGLVLCFAIVIAAELFNTALEVLIDYAWPQQHPMIGRAKDVAAAAVLLTAIGTALVGVLLFGRHLLHFA
ncbi:MAG TPA: diacylglycerol kinase family protein [Candidatus Limnocylindrales bacterium]|nr:diacylglycerol kinase family protein [Candidatus Limnocylindrales bacterium]